MKTANHALFFLLCGAALAIIMYKVFAVPITHDETATAIHYFNFSMWEIMMYPDNWPNNHILNTLLVKVSVLAFGKTQWAIRLPNLLSFLIYGWAVYRILKNHVKDRSLLFIPAAILFIANPYLLDFFGLCRGYGLAAALVTLSASFLITGFALARDKHIWIAMGTAILASYANFTTLVFWVAVTLLTGFYFLQKSNWKWFGWIKPIGILAGVSILYLLLIYTPIDKMQSTNQFAYWTSGGFFRETIVSLAEHWRYGTTSTLVPSAEIIAWLSLALVGLALGFVIVQMIRSGFAKRNLHQPITLATSLLLLTALVSILHSLIMGTPNLSGRTALFFYPLFAIYAATILGKVSFSKYEKPVGILATGVAVLLVIHSVRQTSLHHVREWWFDANTLEVINYLETAHPGETVTLKTHWLFHPSFNFYYQTGKTPGIEILPYDKAIDTTTQAEYYYLQAGDYELLSERYEVTRKFSSDRWLVRQTD